MLELNVLHFRYLKFGYYKLFHFFLYLPFIVLFLHQQKSILIWVLNSLNYVFC